MFTPQCAVCASAVVRTGTSVRCGECATLYCSAACREADDHTSVCGAIKAAGGPIKYIASAAYDEAEAAAASCEKVEGASCFICLESDGDVVRACACRGHNGLAHVACLVEQARAAVELQGQKGVVRWSTCRLCSQQHHGALRLALGRGCWKTYCGRADTDESKAHAMTILGSALRQVGRYDEALTVFEADLAWIKKYYPHDEGNICVSEQNVANTYFYLGQHEQALRRQRAAYAKQLRLSGANDRNSLAAAVNLSSSLVATGRHEDAQDLLRDLVPVAEEGLGENDRVTLKVRHSYAQALYRDPAASRGARREAVALLSATLTRSTRVLGGEHPFTKIVKEEHDRAKAAAKQASRTGSLPPALRRARAEARARAASDVGSEEGSRRGLGRRPGEAPAPRIFDKMRRSLLFAPCGARL
mmetsp:Transcript_8121/g.25422  ORF Transcript_8121/g.25422 Transcript_8121/m.25422 type:complete len:418 (-) Transcript_8121:92-1345(-)